MMKKILLVIFGVLTLSFGLVALPAYATPTGKEACEMSGTEEFKNGYDEELCGGKGEAGLQSTGGNVLFVVYCFIGILAVVFVIIGGFKYTTSQGEPGKVQQAKNTIMYALIGLVVTLSAFAITRFVLQALGGQ